MENVSMLNRIAHDKSKWLQSQPENNCTHLANCETLFIEPLMISQSHHYLKINVSFCHYYCMAFVTLARNANVTKLHT